MAPADRRCRLSAEEMLDGIELSVGEPALPHYVERQDVILWRLSPVAGRRLRSDGACSQCSLPDSGGGWAPAGGGGANGPIARIFERLRLEG